MKSKTGIYHVIVRGIAQQNIFHDEDDFLRYLEMVDRVKKNCGFKLYSYCLMENHVHLLIYETQDELALVMKRLGIAYAWWYNWKYNRTGHVFQDRYKSECVEDDTYLLTVIRYIHQNPVKAGMVTKPDQHRWNSCRVYYGDNEYPKGLIDCSFILDMFADQSEKSRLSFKRFMEVESFDKCLEDCVKLRLSDEDLKKEIETLINGREVFTLRQMDNQERDVILGEIKAINGTTQRQIARVTGLSASLVCRA
jgi:REP element-mobilizing transposase RayT